jgi:hypothetical protein
VKSWKFIALAAAGIVLAMLLHPRRELRQTRPDAAAIVEISVLAPSITSNNATITSGNENPR